MDGEGVQIKFGDGARDGDRSRRVEGRELGNFVDIMVARGLPRGGIGCCTLEVRHRD
jgi:hypothetical protein